LRRTRSGLAQRLDQIALQLVELVERVGGRLLRRAHAVAAVPRGHLAAQPAQRAHEVRRRRGPAEPRADLALQVLAHAAELLVGVAPVDAVHDEDDLLPPLADVAQEVQLARRQRLQQAGDEEDEVRARHEAARDLLLHALDRVRPGRVDDLQVAQHLQRIPVDPRVLACLLGRPRLAVAQDRDDARGGQVAHREHLVAEQRVDERALARVVLAGHHEQEQLVHLGDELHEPLEIGARAVALASVSRTWSTSRRSSATSSACCRVRS
jgi:hypothetical protein